VDDEPTTGELRVDQLRRELDERKRAEDATEEDLAEQHGRRADKAAYLKEKLAEREEAEGRAAADDESKGGRSA
jgi:hypothetical protein